MPMNKKLDPVWADHFLSEQEKALKEQMEAEERKQIMHAVRLMTMQILLKQSTKA